MEVRSLQIAVMFVQLAIMGTLITAATNTSIPPTNTPPPTTMITTPAAVSPSISTLSISSSVSVFTSPYVSNDKSTSTAVPTALTSGGHTAPTTQLKTTSSVTASHIPSSSQFQSLSNTTFLGSSSQSTSNSSRQTPSLSTARDSSMTQSLTPSSSPFYNWTEWSVEPEDCSASCSDKGGTITASRQCSSGTVHILQSVCGQFNETTKVGKCEVYCTLSGTESFKGHCSTVAVSILLTILSILT